MGISILVCILFILSVILCIISKHCVYCIETREEIEKKLEDKYLKEKIRADKLQDELERYKKLHKIYSDYFYRRDTDEIRNEND